MNFDSKSNRWLAFYTKSRHEKKVRDVLTRRGFEVFLPMQKLLRQWSDRKKRVEVPLFNSYIFVHIPYHRSDEVLQVPGVAWAIRHNDKPAELHPKEYETIVRFIETGLKNGALGAKVCGAGGGGCVVYYAKDNEKPRLAKALQQIGGQVLPFSFDTTGTTVW